ncbi:MAG: sigma-E processing peptidase SpoIIGA [Clostridia bacterium]
MEYKRARNDFSCFFYVKNMTIFVEDLFLNNFGLEILLLYLVCIVLNKKINYILLAMCGIFLAIIYIFCLYKQGYWLIVYIAVKPIIIFLFLQFRHIKDYLSYLFLYVVLNCACIGSVILILLILAKPTTNFLYYYGKLPIFVSAILVLLTIDVVYLKKSLIKTTKYNINLHKVEMVNGNGYCCQTIGYYDTGNMVCTKNGEGVVIVDEILYNKLKSKNTEQVIISTIAGTKKFFGTKVLIKIYLEDGTNKIYRATAIGSTLNSNKYKIILHNTMR